MTSALRTSHARIQLSLPHIFQGYQLLAHILGCFGSEEILSPPDNIPWRSLLAKANLVRLNELPTGLLLGRLQRVDCHQGLTLLLLVYLSQ